MVPMTAPAGPRAGRTARHPPSAARPARGPGYHPGAPRLFFAGSAITSERICSLRLVPGRGREASGHGLEHDRTAVAHPQEQAGLHILERERVTPGEDPLLAGEAIAAIPRRLQQHIAAGAKSLLVRARPRLMRRSSLGTVLLLQWIHRVVLFSLGFNSAAAPGKVTLGAPRKKFWPFTVTHENSPVSFVQPVAWTAVAPALAAPAVVRTVPAASSPAASMEIRRRMVNVPPLRSFL